MDQAETTELPDVEFFEGGNISPPYARMTCEACGFTGNGRGHAVQNEPEIRTANYTLWCPNCCHQLCWFHSEFVA